MFELVCALVKFCRLLSRGFLTVNFLRGITCSFFLFSQHAFCEHLTQSLTVCLSVCLPVCHSNHQSTCMLPPECRSLIRWRHKIPLLMGVMVLNLFYFVTRRAVPLLPDGVLMWMAWREVSELNVMMHVYWNTSCLLVDFIVITKKGTSVCLLSSKIIFLTV
jgi:hypothetical protein